MWVWDGRAWQKEVVRLGGKEANVRGIGSLVLIDPEVRYMGDFKYDTKYTDDNWRTIYRNAPIAQKARLIETIRANGDLIMSLIREETNPRLLERLINTSPEWKAPSMLIPLMAHSDPLVRRAAVGQTARIPKNPEIAELLRHVWTNDPNPLMRQAALTPLWTHTADRSLLEEAWRRDSFNDGFRFTALDIWTANDKDFAREKALAVLANPTSDPMREHAINKLASLKDKPGERRVFDALARITKERSFQSRQAAVRALGDYGDKAAIPLIQPITQHSLHFMRNTAKEALAKLEK